MDPKNIIASSAPDGNDAIASTSANSPPQETSRIIKILIQSDPDKMFNIMRFRGNAKVDFAEWRDFNLERENVGDCDEKISQFGTGSEYAEKQKKFRALHETFEPQEKPWILTASFKKLRKFKGTRLGGISDYASYYALKTTKEGTMEAFSLEKWYDFQPIETYKALTAEEAEEEYVRRNKVLNHFELMLRKRFGGETEEMEEPDESKPKEGIQKSKEYDIMEPIEYMDTDDDSNSDERDNQKKPTKKDRKGHVKPKNKQIYTDACDELNDGDDEGREIDYMSSSSESQSELDPKEGNALLKLLNFDGKNDEKGAKESQTPNEKDSNDSKHVDAIVLKPSSSAILTGIGNTKDDDDDISEETVRRYLQQKPRTVVDILKKFKKKKVGMSSDLLAENISIILQKLNPTKKEINNKLYLSIEPPL